MKILVATEKPFAPVAISLIRKVTDREGHELVLLENYRDVSELLTAVADAEALIVRSDKVTADVLNAAKKLKIVVRAGAGYDNLDLEACTAHNVVAMNTPGQNSNAVAELAFEMMLYHARGGFGGKSGTELRGKTLGLHAFGNVGKYMAEIGRGFGMELFAFDPFVGEEEMKIAGVTPCATPEELYSKCRYVSLHMPANEKTKKSVGNNLLKIMPEDAVLVNTARKEVIDEEALLKIFEERTDLSYLSDVEPDTKAVFEEKYKGRFIFTAKKMGAQTEEANINAGVAAAKQIAEYFSTGNEKFRVNK
ncbi:MAG TPA: NAD(P)-dependent oxidoreductase [Bacteroidales bacterium]|nr:NAD(P)-dependent oxidoreductase [Bacteroidales bacterium]HPF02855.1 NAD(P)-dependent oxidoreductase [Bacteroidales bacterium]HPJ58416.1 NAD(P)-dependent oxidoreductase [Bacteroidales bacterium]HPR10778.1 NAD(P)-dependent oxidoreductase [Bacteroidales bacterium]HRW86069.1 NAD(P)-dependent oxidoreductase [Bacteroidales bacterium]